MQLRSEVEVRRTVLEEQQKELAIELSSLSVVSGEFNFFAQNKSSTTNSQTEIIRFLSHVGRLDENLTQSLNKAKQYQPQLPPSTGTPRPIKK